MYIHIYIYCTYISHKIPQKIPHKPHQLPEISGHLFRSVDRIRQVDLSQAMQNRPACKTAVEESIRTTGGPSGTGTSPQRWPWDSSRINDHWLVVIGTYWNHGILNDFPFSWEFHHPN